MQPNCFMEAYLKWCIHSLFPRSPWKIAQDKLHRSCQCRPGRPHALQYQSHFHHHHYRDWWAPEPMVHYACTPCHAPQHGGHFEQLRETQRKHRICVALGGGGEGAILAAISPRSQKLTESPSAAPSIRPAFKKLYSSAMLVKSP